jgi:hypothetical protein
MSIFVVEQNKIDSIVLIKQVEHRIFGSVFYTNLYTARYGSVGSILFYINSGKRLAKDENIFNHDIYRIGHLGELIEHFTSSASNDVIKITEENDLYTDGINVLYLANGSITRGEYPGMYTIPINTGSKQVPEKELVDYDFGKPPVIEIVINNALIMIFNLKNGMKVI